MLDCLQFEVEVKDAEEATVKTFQRAEQDVCNDAQKRISFARSRLFANLAAATYLESGPTADIYEHALGVVGETNKRKSVQTQRRQ